MNNDTLSIINSADTAAIVSVAKEAARAGQANVILLIMCAVIGAAYHFITKAKRLKAQAGKDWNARSFWSNEAYSIVSSVCIIALAIICKESIAQLKYASIVAGNFMYPTFFVIGYFGDSLVDKILGGYEKKLKLDSKE